MENINEFLASDDSLNNNHDLNETKVDEILLRPFNYFHRMGISPYRELLIKAVNYWFKIPDERIEEIATILEVMQYASLILDDIQDNSILREGRPVAHAIFGTKYSLNAVALLQYKYFQKCIKMHPKLMTIMIEQLLILYRGQGIDIYWRDTLTIPTEEEYCQMTKQKTGGMFVFAIRLIQLYSDLKTDFTDVIEKISLYFQIRDDYVNLTSEKYMEGKSMYDDISEGKFSFVILHAISVNSEIMDFIIERPKDLDTKKRCVQLIKECGSFEYTKEKLKSLQREILVDLKTVDENYQNNEYFNQVLASIFDIE